MTQKEFNVLYTLLMFDNSQHPLRENFLQAQTRLTRFDLRGSLDRLIRDGYADYSIKSGYYATLEGRSIYTAYAASRERPKQYEAWCTEALTGIRPDGRQSDIDNAALPAETYYRQTDRGEDRLISSIDTGRRHDA